MALDLSSFFSAGVEELGEVAQAKDVAVSAEAKASAEEFVEKNEKYENEVETNRNKLKKSAKAITSNLGINDVGKIRTIISAYGNEDTIKELEKDFATYQMKTIAKENDGKFKTLSEYVKGKISGSGTTFLSDEAAEQAEDEAAIIGDELDIQKAEKRAKAQGVTLEEYLNNEARAMSSRPAFNIEARAARLVEESKMGIFGKTLTMEEARQKVTGGKSMGEKAKDLGDTGYAIEREGGLSPEQKIKIEALVRQKEIATGENIKGDDILKLRKSIIPLLPSDSYIKDSAGNYSKNDKTDSALIKFLENSISNMEKAEVKDVAGIKKRQRLLAQIRSGMGDDEKKNEIKPKKPKPPASAIRYLRNNPDKIDEFIKRYGENAVPLDMKK
jgi:hypothetical protein